MAASRIQRFYAIPKKYIRNGRILFWLIISWPGYGLRTRYEVRYSSHYVGQHLEVRGVDTSLSAFRPEWVEQAADLYRNARTLDEIAEMYGVGYTTAWRYLTAAGVEMRRHPRRRPSPTTRPPHPRHCPRCPSAAHLCCGESRLISATGVGRSSSRLSAAPTAEGHSGHER